MLRENTVDGIWLENFDEDRLKISPEEKLARQLIETKKLDSDEAKINMLIELGADYRPAAYKKIVGGLDIKGISSAQMENIWEREISKLKPGDVEAILGLTMRMNFLVRQYCCPVFEDEVMSGFIEKIVAGVEDLNE